MRFLCLVLACQLFLLPVMDASDDQSDRTLSRQKKSLFYPQFSVYQLSMCMISQVSSIPSHRVSINSGFQINYQLPFSLSQFYSPMYWARSLTNMSNPMMDFFERLAQSDTKDDGPDEADDEEDTTETFTSAYDGDELVTEPIDDEDEFTTPEATTEVTTTTKKPKRKRKPKMKRETSTVSDLTAGQFYSGLKETLSYSGYHEDCLLKSVCELAHHPLQDDEDEDHLTHEIVHFILTPSLHQSFDPETEVEEKENFEEAERLGKSGADCDVLYPNCDTSPLHRISRFIHGTNEI